MQTTKDRNLSHKRYAPWEAILLFGVIGIFMVLILIPFLLLLSGSFSDSAAISETGVGFLPKNFTLDAYRFVFRFPQEILESYLISIVVTVSGTVLNLLLCLPVAYALARTNFTWKTPLTVFFVFTLMFNGGYAANYILFRNVLNLYDTWWVLIVPPAGMVSHMILLRVFYGAVPEALYESASIDGASEYRIFLSIATPLIVTGISTAAFYSVLFYWNDPFQAMLYTDNVVPVALYLTRITQYIEFLRYAQESGFAGVDLGGIAIPEETLVFAIAIATTAPMLCVFVAFQKYFVRGLTAGSVKG